MRKLLALLALVAVCVLSMASCDVINGLLNPDSGEEECEHTFATEWSSNATQHWHAATCEHGEIRDQLADHADADEDGLCDVCAYEIGHEHTFAAAWTVGEDSHWKEATCSHSDEKGSLALHSDDNTDGVCDVCAGHVHILDGAGFCTGCDKEVKPVDETDFASVASATTARGYKVKSGKVEYVVITRSRTEATGDEEYSESRAWDIFEIVFGTNGVYTRNIEDEVVSEGEGLGAVAVLTGNYAMTEHWVAFFEGENGLGIEAVSSVDPDTLLGEYVTAMPASFGAGDLLGYFFAVPGLANGNGADAMLYALAEMALNENASELLVVADPENNTISFSYNVFVVNATHMSDDTMVYQVNYFEVAVSFSYTDDYAITSLEITVDSYTNEPGSGQGISYAADIDLDYDPVTETMTLRPDALPHTYYYKVTQEVGEREEIELKDMDFFMPDDFNVYGSDEGGTPITELEGKVGDRALEFYVIGEGGFASFLYDAMTVTVTDGEGNVVGGLGATPTGAAIQLLPNVAGVYYVNVSAMDITRTVKVTIEDNVIVGQYSFQVTATETYDWETNECVFRATETGKYTFYFPGNVGLRPASSDDPYFDPQTVTTGDSLQPYSYEVTLRANQTFTFYIWVRDVSQPYTVYYDFAAPNSTN